MLLFLVMDNLELEISYFFLGKKNILNSIDFIFQPYGILNHAKPKKNIDP